MQLEISLHEKQGIAFESTATEILYGGAAGGGKSHLMRVCAIVWCAEIPGFQAYLFRRIHDDLVRNHLDGPYGFRAMLAPWALKKAKNGKPFVEIVEDEIRFWNGSKIYLCHCKDEKHRFKYQGAEIHALLIDELTHFTDTIYRFLRNRMRKPKGLRIPPRYVGKFPCALLGANPGNIGHLWVKESFIDNAGSYEIRQMPKSEGGMLRQFIPALLEDNPSLDPEEYEGKLMGLGSEELVRAMRYGDWDVIEGAFFDCWNADRHVVAPFQIPQHWLRFRSMDWGSASPFSVGWWAVVSDTYRAENKHGQAVTLPRGCLVRYREWYGASKANVGLKLKNEAIGAGIKERESKDGKISYGVLDPACFAEDGGPSIHEQMRLGGGPAFRPADNTRIPLKGAIGGWAAMRSRMLGDLDGNPMIVCFSTCHDSIRTIPALVHDDKRPEDVETEMEDHAADEWRYACLSRPWTRPLPKPDNRKPNDYSSMTQEQDSWR